MHKGAHKMAQAMTERRDAKAHHDRVVYDERNNVSICTFHDHRIAELDHDTRALIFMDAGYQTVSTKDRLNQLGRDLVSPRFDIRQKDGVWFVTLGLSTPEIVWTGDLTIQLR